LINEIKGDIFQGAFQSSLSLPLLAIIASGLKDVDIALGWVDHKTYNDRVAEMKQLEQELGHVP